MQQSTPDAEVVINALKLACRAPSIHNSQPWHWMLDGPELRLFVDRSRWVVIADSSGREAIISCGTMLDHLRVAMAASGWQSTVNRFPDPKIVIIWQLSDSGPTNSSANSRYKRAEAILQRRTDRLPFRPPNFWAWCVPDLQSTVGDSGTVMLDVLPTKCDPSWHRLHFQPKSCGATIPAIKPNFNGGQHHSRYRRVFRPDAIPSSSESSRIEVARDFPAADETHRRSGVAVDWSTILLLSTGEIPELKCCGAARCCPPCSWTVRWPVWQPAR